MALRGRLLVGSRPLSRDLVSRFVASAADSGIDIFRIHDPLNDLANLQDAAEAIRRGEEGAHRRPRAQPRPERRHRHPARAGESPGELGASRVLIHDPSGSLDPAKRASWSSASVRPAGCRSASTARERVERRWPRRSRRRAQARLSSPARSIRSRSRSIASRPNRSRSRWPASASTPASTSTTLWRGSELVDDALGDVPVPPLSPRVAVRAAEHSLPAGLVAELDANLRAHSFSDRLDEVLASSRSFAANAAGRRSPRRSDRSSGHRPSSMCSLLSAGRSSSTSCAT